MGRVLRRIVAIVLTSPVTAIMVGWVLMMGVISAIVTLMCLASIVWTISALVGGTAELMNALVTLMAIGGVGICYYITWVSAGATRELVVELFDDVRKVRDTTRQVLTERADRAEAKAQRGGRLSMSVGDGTGGELTQAAYTASGLELVEQGVALDLGGCEGGGEAEDVARAEVVSEVV